MTKRLFLLVTALFVLGYCQTTLAQAPVQKAQRPALREVSVEEVIKYIKARVSKSIIIAQIRKRGAFDPSPDQIIQLQQAGAATDDTNEIIEAMMNPQALKVTAPATSPAAPSSPSATSPVVVQTAPQLTPVATPSAPVKLLEAAKPAPTQKIKLRDGERIRLLLREDISSATANVGDRINLTVAEDIKVNDAIVIGKGASAVGSIVEAKKKGMLGRGGKLTMSMEFVKAVDDQSVRIRSNAAREGDDKTGKTVVVFIFGGPLAVLVKGKDVVATRGTEFSAYIDEEKEILVK